MIFTWMPVLFTFMLAGFPAGLVIYWAWNNTLSILQQYFIMRRHGTKIDLWRNIRDSFRRPSRVAAATAGGTTAIATVPKAANDTGSPPAAAKAITPPKSKPKKSARPAGAKG